STVRIVCHRETGPLNGPIRLSLTRDLSRASSLPGRPLTSERVVMTKARLLILLVLCAVWPATAHGQSETADWIQGGSGPGPSTTPFIGYEVRVWCLPTSAAANTAKRRAWDCLLNDPEKTRAVLSFGQTFASSGNHQLFVDDLNDVRNVKLRRYTTAFTYRAN